MPQFVIRYHLRDNNGKEAQVRIRPADQTESGATAYALALASAISAISDALLYQVDISFKANVSGLSEPGPDSNSRVYAALFYRNVSRVASVNVPSPGRLLTEDAGPYAGVRYTRSTVGVSGLLDTVEAIATLLVDGLGRPYPTTFSVGGRIEL